MKLTRWIPVFFFWNVIESFHWWFHVLNWFNCSAIIDAERVLAESNPTNQKSRPHTLFASGPPTLPTHANGAVMAPVPPRPFANGAVAQGPVPALHRPPPLNAAFTPMQVAGQPAWRGQPLQQGQPMPPPPVQFRPPPPNMPRPPPQAAPMFPRPPPQHMAMEAQPQVWQQPPPPQHFSGRPPMPQMLMQPRPPPNAPPPPPPSWD